MAWTVTLTDETGTITLHDGTQAVSSATYHMPAAAMAAGLTIREGRVTIPLMVQGTTADGFFNALGSLEAAMVRATQSSRSAAGPYASDANRTVLTITQGTTDASYARVR